MDSLKAKLDYIKNEKISNPRKRVGPIKAVIIGAGESLL